jgi:hypothetical protein
VAAPAADSAPGSFTEPVLCIGVSQMLDQRINLAIHDGIEVMHRVSDSMIGDAILGEIVRSDFRRSIAGANLSLSHS